MTFFHIVSYYTEWVTTSWTYSRTMVGGRHRCTWPRVGSGRHRPSPLSLYPLINFTYSRRPVRGLTTNQIKAITHKKSRTPSSAKWKYCLFKKSCPILHSNLLYKMGQDQKMISINTLSSLGHSSLASTKWKYCMFKKSCPILYSNLLYKMAGSRQKENINQYYIIFRSFFSVINEMKVLYVQEVLPNFT